ncbi:TetR/AcrR family transcriptional regulator [Vitiosangium sp. GDMCC 1.1324]|uniref:TetR/AcrR family transcriptional regulator n=1 Tax=Vitiosangium sp. (strain GDMCC 1.1324) TaxID=2138576 RepID=UPI000D3C3737|nr:TetR/AcrR family transcriptional regulator [Vitiosangium sp. GDMCC 1.1324]PTL77226.1 TetR family transcriptional regulator [Vitiosangium sp. GDMCC 1.1324]
MVSTKGDERDAMRRAEILEAARECFLQFGYAKTSLDDIARRANISRPLIYRKFKNKEDIFAALFDFMLEGRYPKAEQALAGPGSKRDKLFRVYELLLLEPWDEMVGAPMAAEFYEACSRLLPEVEAKHERLLLKLTQAILETKELSEVFMLAVDGLQGDLPATRVLRRRLQLLVERFVP